MTFAVPKSVDLLVVGSGPAGAAFARVVHERLPDARILMVEVGPRLTDQAGENTRNLPPEPRHLAQLRSQGPHGDTITASATGRFEGHIAPRPGTFLVADKAVPVAESNFEAQSGMPAAAMSSNVGGMSAHWTCACPAPGDSERNPFLTDKEFDAAFARAADLLRVTTSAFRPTASSTRVQEVLGRLFDPGRPPDRVVQPMPLACQPSGAGLPWWSGSAQVLGPLAEPGGRESRFTLSSDTLCRRLILDGARVRSVELEYRPTGERRTVEVKAVAVAADTLRTPQLLWASDVRPPALGRYLNDQPQIIAAVEIDMAGAEHTGPADPSETPAAGPMDARDQLTGVLWVPFADGSHPFHSQVMQLDASPIAMGADTAAPGGPVVGLGWFTTKQPRAEDRIEFSADRFDDYGMPAMTIHYELTDADHETIAAATTSLTKAADALGTFVPGGEPRLLPAGSSMHYQGTVRMGAEDDGTSVCDVTSRVWGMDNLFVGGNGVIPTPTACNPTATSVAMAVISAEAVADLLSG